MGQTPLRAIVSGDLHIGRRHQQTYPHIDRLEVSCRVLYDMANLAQTLVGVAAQCRRRLNFQQPTALTTRPIRGERDGSRGGLLVRTPS